MLVQLVLGWKDGIPHTLAIYFLPFKITSSLNFRFIWVTCQLFSGFLLIFNFDSAISNIHNFVFAYKFCDFWFRRTYAVCGVQCYVKHNTILILLRNIQTAQVVQKIALL